MLGPEANRFIFLDSPELFRWRDAFEVLLPLAGEAALLLSDGEAHKRRRRLVMPAFHKKRIEAYIGIMAQHTQERLRRWQPGGQLDVHQEMRSLVRSIVIRTLFGERLAKHTDSLGEQIETMLRFVYTPYFLQMKVDVPGTSWNRLRKARAASDALIHEEIARRRREGTESDDLLSLLVSTRDEQGDSLDDQEVRDMVMSLITGGYDTSSSALAWTVALMLQTPGSWERARDESQSVLGSAVPTPEDLPKLRYMDWVISEALRLYPPVFMGTRRVAEPFEFFDYQIEKGHMVIHSPYITHRLARVWERPDEFVPERWDQDRPGYREPSLYEYDPFGIGARRCIGASFVLTEMKVVLSIMVRTMNFEPLFQKLEPTGFGAMYPKDGVFVRVRGNEPRRAAG